VTPLSNGSKLSIALFHSTLPEPGRKLGGVEVFVHRLASRLIDRGHDVTVITYGTCPQEARYRVVRPGDAWLATRAARLTIAPLVLNRLHQSPYDVLHLHGDDWFFLRRRVPTVRTFHGSAFFEARTATSWRRRVMQSAIYPLEAVASRLATMSFDVGSGLPPGYRTQGSLVNAVDQPTHRAPTTHSAHPMILFVGTWRGRKRGAFLADCFVKDVLPRHPTAELVMVSDSSAEYPGVRLVKSPSDAELSTLYSLAWIFCMPSAYEGFGMPYLEAMSHGLPVVATPNPGAQYVLGDEAGRIVSDSDLGRVLADLLGDCTGRSRLARAGRERSLAFTWDRVIAEHEAAYLLAITRFEHQPAR
jgi:glycosyltransferase involved in cell wall biosynthesis